MDPQSNIDYIDSNINFRSKMSKESCRTCLSTDENMNSLFTNDDRFSMPIKDMIMSFTKAKISIEDSLTKFICANCTLEAVTAYSFKLKCEKSEEILKSNSVQLKNEDLFTKNDNIGNDLSPKIEDVLESDSNNIDFTDIEDNFPLNQIKNEFNAEFNIDKKYECAKCHKGFKSKQVLYKHYIKYHSYKPFDRAFKNKCIIKRTKNYIDNDIKKSNKSDDEKLTKNIQSNNKQVLCDECDYQCSNVGILMKHKRKHSSDKPFACDKCPYRTRTAYALKTHASTHTTAKPFSCSKCPFTCKLLTSLVQHIARKHDQRKDYVCDTCGKRFFSASHRNIHKRVHTGERPYSCDKCGLAFSQKSNLEKHINVVHSETPKTFSCTICNYVARSIYTLKCHEKKHTGERPLKCDLCDYSCITSSALKLHKQRHTGDAKYNCELCNYKCYTASRLKDHKRTHTGERPYSCDLCDYRAKTDTGLRNHKISHTNEQKYSCTNCLYKTNYKSNLTKHELKLCGRMAKTLPSKIWNDNDVLCKEKQAELSNEDV